MENAKQKFITMKKDRRGVTRDFLHLNSLCI